MPKIVAATTDPVLTTASAAHHYRFIGVEFTTLPTVANYFALVILGSDRHSASQVPHHIIFDRCWIHGVSDKNVRFGVIMHSSHTAVVDSYISDIHEVGGESKAIGGWNGPGPLKIVNNYLEAASINLLLGGANPSIVDLVPSDIEIRRNHFFKPLSWKQGEPTYAGIHWQVKNLLEIKAGRRVWVDGNIFEHSWADGQEGWAIRIVLGSDRYAAISDITFTNNIVRHAANGFDVCGNCSTASSVVNRVSVRNNTDCLRRHTLAGQEPARDKGWSACLGGWQHLRA